MILPAPPPRRAERLRAARGRRAAGGGPDPRGSGVPGPGRPRQGDRRVRTAIPGNGRRTAHPGRRGRRRPDRSRSGRRKAKRRPPRDALAKAFSFWSPLAAGLGFEPRLSDPESPGLPLPHPALTRRVYATRADADNGARDAYTPRTPWAARRGRPAAPDRYLLISVWVAKGGPGRATSGAWPTNRGARRTGARAGGCAPGN